MTDPTIPQDMAIIIKPFPRSQFQSPLAQCKFLTSHKTPTKETTTLHRSDRVSKPNKRYADTLKIASVVKNNLWLWPKVPPKGTVHML